MRISVVVIALDEALRLPEALDSAGAVADEILVCDGGSTDDTPAIAAARGCHVITHPFEGFAAQRNHAASAASGEWILALDADERVSPALRDEILSLKHVPHDNVAAFRMPRRSRYLGRWIRHSGWYPNHQTRLYRRDRGRWVGDHLHERLLVDGRIVALQSDLLHESYSTLTEHLRRIPRYAQLGAQARRERGVRGSPWRLVARPVARALRAYVWRAGCLDGVPGLLIAILGAYGVFAREALLWEATRSSTSRARAGGDAAPRPR